LIHALKSSDENKVAKRATISKSNDKELFKTLKRKVNFEPIDRQSQIIGTSFRLTNHSPRYKANLG
jgi:hypothetical protein